VTLPRESASLISGEPRAKPPDRSLPHEQIRFTEQQIVGILKRRTTGNITRGKLVTRLGRHGVAEPRLLRNIGSKDRPIPLGAAARNNAAGSVGDPQVKIDRVAAKNGDNSFDEPVDFARREDERLLTRRVKFRTCFFGMRPQSLLLIARPRIFRRQ
jgi:hypothetical protein